MTNTASPLDVLITLVLAGFAGLVLLFIYAVGALAVTHLRARLHDYVHSFRRRSGI